MRWLLVVGSVATVLGVAGCGSSTDQQATEELKRGAEQAQSSAESVAKGVDELAKGLQGLAGGDPDAKPVDPVSFRDLQAVFGDISGWEKGKPTGERMTAPVNFSIARVTYTKGEASIDEEISDSAFNQLLLVPYSMFLTSGFERETDEGYEKSTKVGEYPGWEKWNSRDKSGELNAIVARRFIVQVNGRNVDDIKVLHQAMASTDLRKLAELK